MKGPTAFRVFTPLLELAGEIEECSWWIWTSAWEEAGSFRLEIPGSALYAKELATGRILALADGSGRSGIITELRYRREDGSCRGVRILVLGRELSHILSFRLVLPTAGGARYEHRGPAESVMKTLVACQCGAYALPSCRRFDRANGGCAELVVAPDRGEGGEYLLSARYARVAGELAKCARSTGLGQSVRLDCRNRCLVFEVHRGVDRRESQSANPRALLSADFDSIGEAELWRSDTAKRTAVYASGSGEPGAGPFVDVESEEAARGFGRREEFLDARDLATEEDLRLRAGARLAEDRYEDFFECAVPTGESGMRYGADYRLGDEVTVAVFGQRRTLRITRASESRSLAGREIRLGFDRAYPELGTQSLRFREDTEASLRA